MIYSALSSLLDSRCLSVLIAALAVFSIQARGQVAIRDATIVDVRDGSLNPNQSVLIEGNRIQRIGPSTEIDVPADAEVVDASGLFLIPGLWDMHVHTANNPEWAESFLPLYLANGVTGVRDMWHYREIADSALAAIKAGNMPGPPRMIVAGNLIDGPGRVWSNSLVAYTPEEGRQIVDSLHAAGVPFIKVYSTLSAETYHAIAERSRSLGIPFVGHVPSQVTAAEASNAGQRSTEHFLGVLEGCSSAETAIIDDFVKGIRAIQQGKSTLTPPDLIRRRAARALDTQDENRCRELARIFAENETWQVPTLVAIHGQIYRRELAAAGDPRLDYLAPSVYENAWDPWHPESNPSVQQRTGESWATSRGVFERLKAIINLMVNAGVPFLAGSDAPNPWAFPGFGLHDELELFVEAGLTPLQALQTATVNPARFFRRTDDMGTIEEGKLADLVLLDGNPLEEISNTTKIEGVIADGRLYRRDELDQILASAAERADRVSVGALVYEALERGGIDEARRLHERLLASSPDSVRFAEQDLNALGYRLLGQERIDEAVAVFEMNTVAYPNEPNPFDSLGDGLRAAGRLEDARNAYARAVEIATATDAPGLNNYRRNLKELTEELEAGR